MLSSERKSFGIYTAHVQQTVFLQTVLDLTPKAPLPCGPLSEISQHSDIDVAIS